MGSGILLDSFLAVILGGLGNLPGTAIGALFVALVKSIGAVAFGTFPRSAKSRRVELLSARASLSRLSVRLPGHFTICGQDHFELSAARGGSGKWLSVEEGCLNIARCHGLRSKGETCRKECSHNNEWWGAHENSPSASPRPCDPHPIASVAF
jgi:Branched-chain amino acid transport system / permease component